MFLERLNVMKKIFVFLIAAIVAVSSFTVFADTRYENYINQIKSDTDIDFSEIDEESIFLAEFTNDIVLKKDSAPSSVILAMSEKNSGNKYAVYFDNGKLTKVLKDFKPFEQLEDFSMQELDSYLQKNNLASATDVKALIVLERLHMYAYSAVCGGKQYIIPYCFLEDSIFNVTDEQELTLKIGQAYTLAEFIDICEKERETYQEYMTNLRKEQESNEPSVKQDDDGNIVEIKEDGTKSVNGENNAKNENKNENKLDDNNSLKDKPDKDAVKEPAETNEDNKNDVPAEENKTASKPKFTDVPQEHWAYAEVTELADEGVILGYGDGKFGADDSVTYEQLSLLLKRLFNYDETNTQPTAAKREDIITALVKALGADVSTVDENVINQKFSDGETIKDDNRKYIAYAVNSKLAVGYGGKLYTDSNVTRAETAVLLSRAVELNK